MPYAEHLKQPGDLMAVTLKLGEPGMVWAYISDVPRVVSIAQLIEELRRLETACWRDGVIGWYCACATDNRRMRRWIEAVGATAFKEEEGRVFYVKKILADPAGTWRPTQALASTIIQHQEAEHG